MSTVKVQLQFRLLHPAANPFKMRQLTGYASRRLQYGDFRSAPASRPRPRVGKLCVAIQAASPAEMMERAEAALGGLQVP